MPVFSLRALSEQLNVDKQCASEELHRFSRSRLRVSASARARPMFRSGSVSFFTTNAFRVARRRFIPVRCQRVRTRPSDPDSDCCGLKLSDPESVRQRTNTLGTGLPKASRTRSTSSKSATSTTGPEASIFTGSSLARCSRFYPHVERERDLRSSRRMNIQNEMARLCDHRKRDGCNAVRVGGGR